MRAPPAGPSDNRLVGVAFIVLATLTFSTGDLVSKRLLETVSPLQVSWLRAATAASIALAFAWWRLGRGALVTANPRAQILRGTGVVMASILFLWSLSLLTLTEAVAINFLSPILMTALSAPLLGERIGPRRWIATCFGFVGVLIVLRPGSGVFNYAAIIGIFAALCWALSVVYSRRTLAAERPETTLAWSMTVGFVVVCFAAPFDWQSIGGTEILQGLIIGTFSALGHAFIIFSFSRATPTLLAPFTYMQLVWSTLYDVLLIGNIPDRWTLIGAGVIVASGLYTLYRTSVRARGG